MIGYVELEEANKIDIDGNEVVDQYDYQWINLYASFGPDEAVFAAMIEQNVEKLVSPNAVITAPKDLIQKLNKITGNDK